METIAEPLEAQQIQAKPLLKQRVPFFTKENAKALAAKSHETKKRLREEREAELARLELENKTAQSILIAKAIEEKPAQAVEPEESYRTEQLARTRKGLGSLWSDFDAASDPKERKFLSDAIGRLTDVEFALSGRSKPGLTRPTAKKPTKAGALGPIEAE